ncbi:MAG: metallophosphoesterase family protein, partial [Chitinophagales bacterium]
MNEKVLQLMHEAEGTHKVRRAANDPVALPKSNQRFVPIPSRFVKPNPDLNLDLKHVVTRSVYSRIIASGKFVFHMVGDTGGINDDAKVQTSLAELMEKQITSAAAAEKSSLFYHLGDVVYYNGITLDYPQQFDEPYKHYPAKIVAIPGNHDGQISVMKGDKPDHEASLLGFMQNFCDKKQEYSGYSSYRKTMNQPWLYWTLNAPFITIIGLYSNIDGSLDDNKDSTQYDWLVNELKKAPHEKCLVITIHHPCFSLDTSHGGYPLILKMLDQAFDESGRTPHAIFSGHVHNYQRFTRKRGDKQMVYINAGAGGYASNAQVMHKLYHNPKTGKQINPPYATANKEVTLQKYQEKNPG